MLIHRKELHLSPSKGQINGNLILDAMFEWEEGKNVIALLESSKTGYIY